MAKRDFIEDALKTAAPVADYKIKFPIPSREEMIVLGCYLAQAFPKSVFFDPKNIPVIYIDGDQDCGKTVIVEAMMKMLLDQTDPMDMLKPDAPRKFFLEDIKGEAAGIYCAAHGTIDGTPVILNFDRIANKKSSGSDGPTILRRHFRKHAPENMKDPTGAIFRSNMFLIDHEPWIEINLEKNVLTMVPTHKTLQDNLKFRTYWASLAMAVSNKKFSISSITKTLVEHSSLSLKFDGTYLSQMLEREELQKGEPEKALQVLAVMAAAHC